MTQLDVFGCIRRLPSHHGRIFLTFDDGPDPESTPAVLKSLARFNAKATFFLVGQKAERFPELVRHIAESGHSVGDHSWDHRYRTFFQSRSALEAWIRRGHDRLADILGDVPVAFRSPAGVRTPLLPGVLRQLGIPWVHWSVRFYDTVWPFSWRRADWTVGKIRSGDILLLHDRAASVNGGLERLLERSSLKFASLQPNDLSVTT